MRVYTGFGAWRFEVIFGWLKALQALGERVNQQIRVKRRKDSVSFLYFYNMNHRFPNAASEPGDTVCSAPVFLSGHSSSSRVGGPGGLCNATPPVEVKPKGRGGLGGFDILSLS